MRTSIITALAVCAGALAWVACSSTPSAGNHAGSGNSAGTSAGGSAGSDAGSGGSGAYIEVDSGDPDASDPQCSAAAKVVYLVSEENDLWSFDPTQDHMAAYTKIGALNCPSSSTPQSMSVDKDGKAWVFYSDGHMFWVSTADATCQATSYVHPASGSTFELGMGFTATAPQVFSETLYIVGPDFGLATVDLTSLAVTKLGVYQNTSAELTGGMDALLFMFDASAAQLSQVDLTNNYAAIKIHKFSLSGVSAFAFARYAGVFYTFTSNGITKTRTTSYDPAANIEQTRDANIGCTVVGAGQSICVPQPVK